jgi:hypothetical protein
MQSCNWTIIITCNEHAMICTGSCETLATLGIDQRWSPWGHGLGLEARWVQFRKFWPWFWTPNPWPWPQIYSLWPSGSWPRLYLTSSFNSMQLGTFIDYSLLHSSIKDDKSFALLHVLTEVLCSPAISAPAERVFSHSVLCMPPHRTTMEIRCYQMLCFSNALSLYFDLWFFLSWALWPRANPSLLIIINFTGSYDS